MQGHEQRRDARFPAQGKVGVILVSVAGQASAVAPFNCEPGDISLRGVGLVLESPLEINAPVQLQVHLGGDTAPFEHAGRVAWCRPVPGASPAQYNAGIQFMIPDGPDLIEWRVALLGLF